MIAAGTALGIALFAFLVGSIPFGVVVARRQGVDLTSVGSGNIGATNAMRVLGTKWGLVVFALDVVKGVLPSALASFAFPHGLGVLDRQPTAMLLGAVAILGHSFSPWIGFKGGKGISTILGVALGAIPLCGLLSFATMLLVLALTRYVSLASLVGVASGFAWNRVLGDSTQMLPVIAILLAFIVHRHRGNIRRLLDGTEPKFRPKTSGSG